MQKTYYHYPQLSRGGGGGPGPGGGGGQHYYEWAIIEYKIYWRAEPPPAAHGRFITLCTYMYINIRGLEIKIKTLTQTYTTVKGTFWGRFFLTRLKLKEGFTCM